MRRISEMDGFEWGIWKDQRAILLIINWMFKVPWCLEPSQRYPECVAEIEMLLVQVRYNPTPERLLVYNLVSKLSRRGLCST